MRWNSAGHQPRSGATPTDTTPTDTTPTDTTLAASAGPVTVSDFNTAPNGRHLFTANTANPPQPLTEGGILITERHGEVGWQLAIVNDAPDLIWQRSWNDGKSRWRNWKKFTNAATTGQQRGADIATFGTGLKAEIATERTAEIDAELKRRLTAEEAARAAAIAAAIDGLRAEIAADIPTATGLDRDAVQALVDAEIADERQARVDAITLATTSIIQTRQAGIDSAVTAAIATERAAADARTDDKIDRVTGRIDDLADDVTAETAARTAGDAEVKRGLESRLVNDRAEFKQALQRESAARTAGIDAEKYARTAEMDAERTARTRAITEGDRAVKAELVTKIAAAEARMGSRVAATGFPRGTRMLFQQSSAPTGWTKDTSHNDKALRVVSGAVGSGGSKGFAATFGRPRVSGSVISRVSGRTANHRLTVAEMPSHRHGWSGSASFIRSTGHSADFDPRPNAVDYGSTNQGVTEHRLHFHGDSAPAGGNQSHSHGAGSLRVDSAFHGSELDLRVAYLDVIVAVKD